MFRRTFLLMALSLGMALSNAIAPAAHAEASAEDARQFINTLADRAIVMVADKSIGEKERDDRFRDLFVSSFDIPEIGRFVLGRYWRMAKPDQQQEFLKLFEDITTLTWARRFQDYSGERVETAVATRDGEHGWLVDSRIVRESRQPVQVQWRLRDTPQGLRVVDIIVEGVSMAITHRSDYSAAMQGNGGQFDALLQTMRTRLDQMRAAG